MSSSTTSSMQWTLPSRQRIRAFLAWLKPPRRLHFTRGGALFTAGALAIGFSAVNTGDNLLYLLLGAMMGFIAVSGWLSEQVVRGIEVKALPPRAATAGSPARVGYELVNGKRRVPSYALEIVDDAGGRTFAAVVQPGHAVIVRAERVFPRRGVYTLGRVRLATSFPFGLFVKERDVAVQGEVVVWPRRDRPVWEPATAGDQAVRRGRAEGGAAGMRGEFRGLRDYRPGDDPRDVHWRSTARIGSPLVREYERDNAQVLWICLDLAVEEAERAEEAAETAAALADRAIRRNERVALETSDVTVVPGQGRAHLERIMDALARARFRPGAPPVRPPVDPATCVLVGARGVEQFGDSFQGGSP